MPQSLSMVSTAYSDGTMRLSLDEHDIPTPGEREVVVEMAAAPINPSDLGLMLAVADVSHGQTIDVDGKQVYEAPLPDVAVKALANRIDKPMPVGYEGAGTVVDAGSDARAQTLLNKTVAVAGIGSYATHMVCDANNVLELPAGVSAREGASSFVNPMTALGFLETMRLEGHKGIVHTAAASKLGQMLVRLCKADGVPLVNVVRRQEQADLLHQLGATHIVDSSRDDFVEQLVGALIETGATLGFDAIGGGRMVDVLLRAMEIAATAEQSDYAAYGSSTNKQVYIYGRLDGSPSTLSRSYGFTWGVGGWLLWNHMQRVGMDKVGAMRARVADEITTTFASAYTGVLSLQEALMAENVAAYFAKATDQKFLIDPSI